MSGSLMVRVMEEIRKDAPLPEVVDMEEFYRSFNSPPVVRAVKDLLGPVVDANPIDYIKHDSPESVEYQLGFLAGLQGLAAYFIHTPTAFREIAAATRAERNRQEQSTEDLEVDWTDFKVGGTD